MDKNRILAILRSHAPELQAAGIAHLRLFGSVARGEATPQSDIDLMAGGPPTNLRVAHSRALLCG
jgi:predicted nucleotidyltransferase